LRILTATSVALARVARTLMPGYFCSKAAVTGRTSWLMIWVEYQLTSPSFLAASIKAASAARAWPVLNDAASADIASAAVRPKQAMDTSVVTVGGISSRTLRYAAGQFSPAGGAMRQD